MNGLPGVRGVGAAAWISIVLGAGAAPAQPPCEFTPAPAPGGRVSGLIVGMLAATLCDVLLPVFAGRLIDSLTINDGAQQDALRTALWALAVFVGLGLAYRAFREGAMYLWVILASSVMRRLSPASPPA